MMIYIKINKSWIIHSVNLYLYDTNNSNNMYKGYPDDQVVSGHNMSLRYHSTWLQAFNVFRLMKLECARINMSCNRKRIRYQYGCKQTYIKCSSYILHLNKSTVIYIEVISPIKILLTLQESVSACTARYSIRH